MERTRSWHVETLAVVTGRDLSPGAPLNVPATFASTYRDGGEIAYGRWGNPTWSALEEAIGALEGGHAVAFASGLAAVAALLAPLRIGATVVFPTDGYTGTRGLLWDLERRGRINLRPVEVTDTDAVLASLSGADLLWLESPTNPMLGVADLPRILTASSRAGLRSVVDNTFATPLLQQPLALGATAVVHSATKYFGGHSDLLLGAVITADVHQRDELTGQRTIEGAIPGTMEAYLALRGLRTLPVRFARQQGSAQVLAKSLSEHSSVDRVHYPGLVTDPYHARACSQMSGFGAIVSFDVGSAATADRLITGLQLIVSGTSLGGVETTIDRRNRWPGEENVPPGLLRLSVGLEHPDDLWADLEDALDLTR
ncbi:MAG: PLP-dependent aspartate aminotransferase family protein [Acidimicrobiales bacterium]|jgi:cystathionine gamma-synthase